MRSENEQGGLWWAKNIQNAWKALFIYPRRGNHSLSLTNRTARHDAAFQHVRMLKCPSLR
jgi:hypothetical protein